MGNPSNFKIFEDRAKSLFERWGKFDKKNGDSAAAIKGFLSEISDDFTNYLINQSSAEGNTIFIPQNVSTSNSFEDNSK